MRHHLVTRVRLARRAPAFTVAALILGTTTLLACASDTESTTSSGSVPSSAPDAEPAVAAIPFTAAEVTQDGSTFTVEWKAEGVDRVMIYAGSNPSDVGRDLEVGRGGGTGSVTVADLPAAPRWYFELVPDDGDALVVADRSLHLASAPNFRDIGGYRTADGQWVRMGRLYRSDGLDELSPEDLATLDAVGVKLVCDLRTDDERTRHPDVEIPGADGASFNVLGGAEDTTKVITDAIVSGDAAAQQDLLGDGKGEQLMIDAGASFVTLPSARIAYAQMFERLADPASLPAVFHCSAGKDRTGWATASVLTLLGVPNDVVVEDYLLSNDNLAASNAATLAQVGQLVDPALLEPVLGVDRAYLQSSFDTVDAEHGSVEAWMLDGLGLDPATIEVLRSQLLTG